MQTLLIILIVLVTSGGGYLWYTEHSIEQKVTLTPGIKGLQPPENSDIPTKTNTGSKINDNNSEGVFGAENSAKTQSFTQEFTFSNEGFIFVPGAFAVKRGDHVKVTYKNGVGTHDFRIDGYEVGTNVLQTGQSQTFEFTADKAGTFEFFCSVGNHRGMGMKGRFTVTE